MRREAYLVQKIKNKIPQLNNIVKYKYIIIKYLYNLMKQFIYQNNQSKCSQLLILLAIHINYRFYII